MNTAPAELKSLLSWPAFSEHHKNCGSSFTGAVEFFLQSTMDEVRTSASNRVARSIMELIEVTDFGLFRKSVLLRELTGAIAYPKQRDHSAHTLYNYLLGWYFLRYSPVFEKAIKAEFVRRGVKQGATVDWPFSSEAAYFGCVWQYVSLLHDVGYMFEGGIKSSDFRGASEQAAIGASSVREYFSREIWLDYNLEGPHQRSQCLSVLGESLTPPSFQNAQSLAEIADQLRYLGSEFDTLAVALKTSLTAIALNANRNPSFDDSSSDAFELWAHHYECFDNPKMAARVRSMRKVFNGLIDHGMPGLGVKLLDHGVCSGLLLNLAATYYYRLYAAAEQKQSQSKLIARIVNGGKWSPAFWWTGIVWATAATAVHNIQQMPSAAKLDPSWPGKLTLEEDPLAYLGVLVDILEEWDRYSVFKAIDNEPIQGVEVQLGSNGDRVAVNFAGPQGHKRAQKMRENLDDALLNWTALLEVGPGGK